MALKIQVLSPMECLSMSPRKEVKAGRLLWSWWVSDQFLQAMEAMEKKDRPLLVAPVWMPCSGCRFCHLTLFPDPLKALAIFHRGRMRDLGCKRLVKLGPAVFLENSFASLAKTSRGGCQMPDLALSLRYIRFLRQPSPTVHLDRTHHHQLQLSRACQLYPREPRPQVAGRPQPRLCHQTICPIFMRTSPCNPLLSPQKSLLHLVLPGSDEEAIRSLLATAHLARDLFGEMEWLNLINLLQVVAEAGSSMSLAPTCRKTTRP